MKTIITTGGALFFCALTAFADWDVRRSVDEMTDETVFTLSSTGTVYGTSAGVYFYHPTLFLSLRGDPEKGINSFHPTASLSIALAKFEAETSANVTVRFDKQKAKTHKCRLAQERCVAVFPESVGYDVLTNKTVLVRYERAGEVVDTVRFDLTGIGKAVDDAKKMLAKQTKKPGRKTR